mgnify:CR=1 FL=1
MEEDAKKILGVENWKRKTIERLNSGDQGPISYCGAIEEEEGYHIGVHFAS